MTLNEVKKNIVIKFLEVDYCIQLYLKIVKWGRGSLYLYGTG